MRNDAMALGASAADALTDEPRILIVEDDADVAKTYIRQLQRASYRVAAANSIASARQLVDDDTEVFDAAVLDFDLPDGTTLDLVGRLLDRSPLCKSVIVTGIGGRQEALRFVQLGAHAYIEKPLKPSTFLSAVTSTVYATLSWRKTAGQIPRDTARPPQDPSAAWDGVEMPEPLNLHPETILARLRHIAALTPTQTVVAYRLLWGDSDREIAEFLGCAERTAKRHVSQVLAKTGAKTRAGMLGVLLRDAGVTDAGDIGRRSQ